MPARAFLVAVLAAVFSTPLLAAYRIACWIPPWDSNALTSTQNNASKMSESNPVWYTLDSSGNIVKTYNSENPDWRAAMTGTELLPAIQNYVNGKWDGALVASIVEDPAKREAHAQAITQLVIDKVYDGIDIDYESMPATSKDNYSEFIRLLAAKLHNAGKKLSVTVHAKTSDSQDWKGPGAQDYAAIGAAADWVKLMIYDYHWSTSEAGPITPLDWLDQVLTYAESKMPSAKVIAGLPWYGYDWVGTSGSGVSYKEAVDTAAAKNAPITHDSNGEATYTYSDHAVYFQDAYAFDRKADVVVQKHPAIGGFAHWASGVEDPEIWKRIEALKNGTGGSTDSEPLPEASGSTLVPTGATWRYLDNGSDQGTVWTAISFSDGGWPSGPAQLGYGDGDENTVVGFGPDSTKKHVTTYFRYAFNLADPASYSDLTVSILRDDGAVVYLNGTEVWRTNMPTGTIGYKTYASSALSPPEEGTFYSAPVDPVLLVAGKNVVAVEIHQSDAGSSDISFDLQLTGTGAAEPPPPPAAPSSLIATASSSSQVDLAWTDGSADEGGFLIERCAGSGCTSFAQIAQVGAGMTSFNDTGLSASSTYTYRVAAFNSTGNSAYSNSAEATTPAAPQASGPRTFIPTGATWKYLDNGTDQGSTWTAIWFDESTWPSGAAQLGYGDGDEKTVVSYGPDSGNKYITTYFRASFDVPDPSIYRSLKLRLLRDDGAVVYVNGQEALRSNMPTGTIGYRTYAAATCSDESTFNEFSLDPRMLVTGKNVVAVEIHQADSSSSDISFDLELIGSDAPPAPSDLKAAAASSSWIDLTWKDNSTDETAFQIERCSGSSSCTNFTVLTTVGSNITSYTDSGLQKSTYYRYRLAAVSGTSLSAYSNIATAKTYKR